jgi:hypothetical protein
MLVLHDGLTYLVSDPPRIGYEYDYCIPGGILADLCALYDLDSLGYWTVPWLELEAVDEVLQAVVDGTAEVLASYDGRTYTLAANPRLDLDRRRLRAELTTVPTSLEGDTQAPDRTALDEYLVQVYDRLERAAYKAAAELGIAPGEVISDYAAAVSEAIDLGQAIPEPEEYCASY